MQDVFHKVCLIFVLLSLGSPVDAIGGLLRVIGQERLAQRASIVRLAFEPTLVNCGNQLVLKANLISLQTPIHILQSTEMK